MRAELGVLASAFRVAPRLHAMRLSHRHRAAITRADSRVAESVFTMTVRSAEEKGAQSRSADDEREDLAERLAGFELLLLASAGDVRAVRAKLAAAPPARLPALVNFADYDKRTALHVACSDGHPAVVHELLAHNADPALRDRFGATCVDDAVHNGWLPVLRVLADHGAEFPAHVDATDIHPAYTLGRDLALSVASSNARAVHQLIHTFGADVNAANADRRTPLHIACVNEDVPIARLLLELGADSSLTDRWNRSPVDEAKRTGNANLIDLLSLYPPPKKTPATKEKD